MTISSELTFYGGWAGLIAAGAGYWYLQKQKGATKPTRPTRATEDRKEKSKKQSEVSDEEKKRKKARKTRSEAPSPPTVSNVSFGGVDDDTPDDDIDNREFARQLSNAKTGTTFASKAQSGTRQKSVKQSKANKTSFSTDDNAPSYADAASTAAATSTDADADDDLSAASSTKATEKGDVADMLEARSPGPSVLRVTESEKPVQSKPKSTPKPPVVTETKKQRQNRQKNEAAKLARQESEAERKVLLEKQRRTAREAEGRAAKDGSSFMASQGPATSAWTGSKSEQAEAKKPVELLDTFEPTTNGGSSKPAGWQKDVPSEEEQMRLLEQEHDDASWSTVTSKTAKKGKKSLESEPPKEVQSVKPGPATAAASTSGKQSSIWDSVTLQDDEWEVA